jgi:hypothetical protein
MHSLSVSGTFLCGSSPAHRREPLVFAVDLVIVRRDASRFTAQAPVRSSNEKLPQQRLETGGSSLAFRLRN